MDCIWPGQTILSRSQEGYWDPCQSESTWTDSAYFLAICLNPPRPLGNTKAEGVIGVGEKVSKRQFGSPLNDKQSSLGRKVDQGVPNYLSSRVIRCNGSFIKSRDQNLGLSVLSGSGWGCSRQFFSGEYEFCIPFAQWLKLTTGWRVVLAWHAQWLKHVLWS